MPLELLADMKDMRDALRRFTQKELDPIAKVIDQTGTVPEAAMTALRANGYLGMRLDEAFGGGGMGFSHYCLAMEEFSRSHRVFTLLLDATTGLTPMSIQRHGSDAQRDKYLRGLATGSVRMAFALTEPEAGSDSASMRTRAVRAKGGWIINGRKHYINGGDVADAVKVMVLTDPEKRARGGITAFIVDRGTPGFSVTRVDTTIGSEAIKLAELTFEDCFVPDSAVLGNVGEGFKIAMGSLAEGRLSVSCACIGVADRLIEMSVAHAANRFTFGKPLADRQAIQWMLADSAVELTAARAMTYEAVRQVEAEKDIGNGASMCKVFCTEMVGRVADRAVQIHGGMGLVRGFEVERFYRDIRHYRVGEGASEILRMLISREMFRDVRASREARA